MSWTDGACARTIVVLVLRRAAGVARAASGSGKASIAQTLVKAVAACLRLRVGRTGHTELRTSSSICIGTTDLALSHVLGDSKECNVRVGTWDKPTFPVQVDAALDPLFQSQMM